MGSLAVIQREYEFIIKSDLTSREKDRRLGELMTTMEKNFRIPLLQDLKWESENPEVIDLYRKLSLSRDFEDVAFDEGDRVRILDSESPFYGRVGKLMFKGDIVCEVAIEGKKHIFYEKHLERVDP